MAGITITRAAEDRISELKKSGVGNALRISIQGGGCSGFQYIFSLVQSPEDNDFVFSQGNAVIIIDLISLPYLEGSKIDFIDNLMEQGFKIDNPNASSSCGCGTSFSV
jgi:iron-sulfur cluster assembly accessory protein